MPTDKYFIGRIRALEARMLDENKLIRMSDAADFQSAFNILNETDYAPILSKLSHPFDYEEMLSQAMLELKKLCETLAPQNKILEVLWAKYDYENIKILIKAKFNNINNPPLLSCSNIDPVALKNYIYKETGWLNRDLKDLINKAQQIFQDSKNILKVFDFIDNAYLNLLQETAAAQNIPLLIEWVKYLRETSEFKSKLRDGESLSKLELIFRNKDFYPHSQNGIDHYKETNDVFLLEKDIDEFLLNQIKKAKYNASGIEPLLVFYFSKINETKNIGIILECKDNHIETAKIKERIRKNG